MAHYIDDSLSLAYTTIPAFVANGTIAASVLDNFSVINIPQTVAGLVVALAAPTANSTGMVSRIRNTGSARFTVAGTNISINPNSHKDFQWNGSSWSSGDDNSIGWRDTRSANENPQDYNGGLYWEFKQSSVIGLTGSGIPTYIGLTTLRRYSDQGDFSGGPIKQEARTDDHRLYSRYSTSATTWGPWKLENRAASDFDLQTLLTLNGRVFVSLNGEVSWSGRFITMTAGARPQELNGYHDIIMPSVGALISKSNGSTVPVIASVSGQNGLSGGIALAAWESLWYMIPKNTSNASVPANFRIQNYLDSNTGTNGLNGSLVNPDEDANEWVLLCTRDDRGLFKFGTGDSAKAGFQFGQGMDIQTVVDARVQQGLHMEGTGYAFRPWNLTNSAVSFGFSNQLRQISNAANSSDQLGSGYNDIQVPTAGTVVYGVNGAANKAWRATTPNDALYRMGELYLGDLSATVPVVDLDEYNVLWWAPSTTISTVAGTWYYTRYDVGFVVPSHWIKIAQRREGAGDVLLWTGECLKRGEALSRGNHEAILHRSKGEITSRGNFSCRYTQNNFFAGTGANGLNTSGSVAGCLIHWTTSTLMYGMDTGTQVGGNYIWLDIPPVGYAIPMLDTSGTRTRVVQSIGGLPHIPIATWESLIYIPSQVSISTSAVSRGWFVVNYGDVRFIPANAITVVSFSADGAISGTGFNKTRLKIGDGTYVQPGLVLATATPVLNDHAQGTSIDWRPSVVAGQTPPAGTAALPAVTGVSQQNFQFRYIAGTNNGRGRVELAGYINATSAIPDGTIIAFLPGVSPYSSDVSWLGCSARHGANSAVPANCFVVPQLATVGGQSGTNLQVYGFSAANVSAASGGAHGASGLITFAGLSFAHA